MKLKIIASIRSEFIYILLLTCLAIPNYLLAQNVRSSEQALTGFERKLGFTFTCPIGYQSIDTILAYKYSCDRRSEGKAFYAIQNDKKNLIVAFRFMHWNKELEESAAKLIRPRNPNWTADSDYFYLSKVYADTINHKITHLKQDYIKEYFNASNGTDFISSCRNKFLNMPYGRYVVVSKDGRGYVSMAFYYDDSAKENIDEQIQKVLQSKMVYFH